MSIFSNLFSDIRGKQQSVNPVPAAPTDQPAPTPQPADAPQDESFHHERGGAILLFGSQSEGEALKELTLDFVRPFRSRCREVLYFDLRDQESLQSLLAMPNKGIWFCMGFFGAGQHMDLMTVPPVNIWVNAGVPFVRIYGDIPAYYPDAHVNAFSNSINLYVHGEHTDYYRRWFDSRALNLTMHPILFDVLDERPADLSGKIAGKKIIFPKNGNCPEKLIDYWRTSLPPGIASTLETLAAELGSSLMLDKRVDIGERIAQHYEGAGIDLGEKKRLMFFLTAQLDDYLRRIKSTMIARTLLDFPVTIRGVNWSHVDFTGKRAVLDTDSDYARTRQLIDDALAIIDMTPNTQSFHDRVQRAAGRYTAFLTNRQETFVEHFENYRSFTFEFNPDSIRERVEHALSNPEETAEMGLMQAKRMRELASDERYADALSEVIDACALAIGGCPPGTQNFVVYPPSQF